MGFMDWARNLLGSRKLKREDVPEQVIEREFKARTAVSRRMSDNLNTWWDMYVNHPPWESECVRPLGLPGAIGRELSRHALTEFSVSVSGSPRAEYINRQMQSFVKDLSKFLELGLCLGGAAMRPYPCRGKILVETFTTRFTPTRFDEEGNAVGGVFQSEPVQQGEKWYVKLEYHNLLPREDGGSVYVVENKAFKSGPGGTVGDPVQLSVVKEWADLGERWEIENLTGPLFAYFKPPSANNVDPSSPLGISVYAGPTVDLIQQADRQWWQLRREYDTGKRRILINQGEMDVSQVDDEIFEFGRFHNQDFFQFINPEIRDEPLYRGFQRILQRIEYNVGLAFGTISDPQSVEKTATEILAAKQRQFVTEGNIQKALQGTLENLIYAMNAWCDLARLAPAGGYETAYNWGDGVLDDPETRRQDKALDIQLVNSGLMDPVRFVMKWENVDEETARKMLPDMESMTTEPEEEIE